jgi:hypothetical protein
MQARNMPPFPIDLVIPWVDGNDAKWQQEKNKYNTSNNNDKSDSRYRNWNNLQYVFRSIDKYLPWINKVFFITNGQKPEWLNIAHPKLKWITHQEYMPTKYLPTFSSIPIELNLHRIKDLSEHFIYINDDIFFLKPQNFLDYFDEEGKPCDNTYQHTIFNIKGEHGFGANVIDFCCMGIINAHFRKQDVTKGHFLNWYGPYLGLRGQLLALLKAKQKFFLGFNNFHSAQSFKKSTWFELWQSEPDYLHKTCLSKFREDTNVSQYLFRYWQLAKNDFHPKRFKDRLMYNVADFNVEEVVRTISNQKCSMICINDSENFKISNFDKTVTLINNAFDMIMPEKCSFEL